MDKLVLSVLVTREEYCEAAVLRQRRQKKKTAALITGAGLALLILGFIGILFGRYIARAYSADFCLIVTGVIFICCDGLIAPMFRKASAVREYDEKEDLHFASTYVFEGNEVSIRNGKIVGKLPLAMITEWCETDALFTIAYGREISLSVPKRLMEAQQCAWLREKLETNAKGAKV